jgi:hypothetical protein
MSLARPYTRALLRNPNILFWGIAFMAFWFVLGAYVFSVGLPSNHASEVDYTSAWYAIIALFSLTVVAMSIATSMTYGTSALAFAFRYTRLTPTSFAVSLLAAAAAMGLLFSFIMAGLVSGLFSAHFGTVILPVNLWGLVGASVLAGAFMMGLGAALVLVVVNYLGLRSLSFIEFVPLVLAYIFGFAQLYIALPLAAIYASPWNDIESLLYQGFSGSAATVTLTNSGSAALSWPLAVAGLAAWVVGLVFLTSHLLGRVRSVSVQEGRQI